MSSALPDVTSIPDLAPHRATGPDQNMPGMIFSVNSIRVLMQRLKQNLIMWQYNPVSRVFQYYSTSTNNSHTENCCVPIQYTNKHKHNIYDNMITKFTLQYMTTSTTPARRRRERESARKTLGIVTLLRDTLSAEIQFSPPSLEWECDWRNESLPLRRSSTMTLSAAPLGLYDGKTIILFQQL